LGVLGAGVSATPPTPKTPIPNPQLNSYQNINK